MIWTKFKDGKKEKEECKFGLLFNGIVFTDTDKGKKYYIYTLFGSPGLFISKRGFKTSLEAKNDCEIEIKKFCKQIVKLAGE